MIEQTPQADLFIQRLRDVLRRETRGLRAIKIAKHKNIYTCGESGDTVYFVKSGQVKLVMVSSEGQECIFAVHGAGEVFGELSLSGLGERIETATAMEESDLNAIPTSQFLALLGRHSLLEGFIRYLVIRLADQQDVITQLLTADSKHRLGAMLLALARKLGKRDLDRLHIEHRISHEELSEIVGTTRSRISVFMKQFHNLGLIETSAQHHLIVRDKELSDYLTNSASIRD